MEGKWTIKMRCFFCFSDQFDLPDEEYEPQPGEMVRCNNCGKLNDYCSLLQVAKRKGMERAQEYVEKELGKMMKGI